MTSASPRKRGRPPGSDGVETEQRVLTAATRLFAERGFHATGIREVATEAGLTVSALYHYMDSKESLLLSIIRGGLETLTVGGETAVNRGAGPAERLVGLVNVHVIVHALNRLTALVSDNELESLPAEMREDMIERRDRYEDLWRAVLDDGTTEGIFGAPEQRFRRLALLEMCTGVARWYSPAGNNPLSSVAVEFSNMALDLVGATSSGRRIHVDDLEIDPPAYYYAQLTLATEPR